MDINVRDRDDQPENNPSKISFLRDALYTHARQVSEFCQSGFNRVNSYTPEERQEQYADFSARAFRLVEQLNHLITCARNSRSLSGTINIEQLEAKTDYLYEQLEDYGCQLKNIA